MKRTSMHRKRVCLDFELNIMQGRQTKIEVEIDRIVSAVHRNASEQLRNNYQSFARKVFSTSVGRPNTQSPAELKEAITVRVTNNHDQRAVLHCQEITQRFLNSSTIPRRQEVLRMLLKLAELTHRNQEDVSILFREPRKKDLNLTVETNISSLAQVPHQPKKPGQLTQQLKTVRSRGSTEQGVSESDLVRHLAFTFTNTPSSEIVEKGEGYQLRSSLNVSETVKCLVSELADLGWLHRKIVHAAEGQGAVKRAVRLAVQEQLNQFYRWIGTMEHLGREGRLSLRRLQVWAFHPGELLKWLAIMLEAIEPFEGSHILSILNAYRPSGLAAVDGLLSRVLSHALQPLLAYIQRWVYRGELLDPSGEFFILQNRKIYDSEQWGERFRLVGEKVPSILDSDCARMIFSTGKAIHFLLNRCKVLYQVRTPFIQGPIDPASLTNGPFRQWLEGIHGEVSKALVTTMFGQFHLRHHLQSLKNFFLAGKGDFVQQLYDTLREKLSQKKQEITEHSLDGYISDALTRCVPDFRLPDGTSHRTQVADRLLAKKIQFGSGSEGWDCFNFQYSLERIQPLQVLFSPQTMLGYQKIFAFLWRVKQVEETLKAVWLTHSREEAARLRSTRAGPLHALFHSTYLLRAAMLHFLNGLHSYLMVTLEAAWARFTGEAESAKTLDELLSRHKAFQQEALEIALCTPREKGLQLALANIFTVITNFKNVAFRLQDNFQEYYQKLRLYQDRQAMAKRGITVEGLEVPEMSVGKSGKQLREVKGVFDTTLRNLLMLLKKQGEGRPALSLLAAKLDFNQYYFNLYLE